MKSRFATADVCALVPELQDLVGLRLSNLYDVGPKTFLFKFAAADVKRMLLVENGLRVHQTAFARETQEMPSGFNAKLRKHLRTQRLTGVRQHGLDRIILFEFGTYYELVVELFGVGNIILLDRQTRKILTCFHQVHPRRPDLRPILGADPNDPATAAAVAAAQAATLAAKPADVPAPAIVDAGHVYHLNSETPAPPTYEDVLAVFDAFVPDAVLVQTKKRGRQAKVKATKAPTIQRVMKTKYAFFFGPLYVSHLLVEAAERLQRPDLDLPNLIYRDLEDVAERHAIVRALYEVLAEADARVRTCATRGPGYVVLKPVRAAPPATHPESKPRDEARAHAEARAQADARPQADANADTDADAVVDRLEDVLTFAPHPQTLGKMTLKPFPCFSDALDYYYARIEAQKRVEQQEAAQSAFEKRLAAIRASHERHVQALDAASQSHEVSARAIEANADVIEQIATHIHHLMEQGVSWTDIDAWVKAQQVQGNPFALMVVKLDLIHNTISLRLPYSEADADADADEDDENDKHTDEASSSSDDDDDTNDGHGPDDDQKGANTITDVVVDIVINESVLANAGRYYANRKTAEAKGAKTRQFAEQAIKTGERKLLNDAKFRVAAGPAVTRVRKAYWFEKFRWFLSSENYLVVAATSDQMVETLLAKHLEPDDVLVTADTRGAGVVVVKNPWGRGNAVVVDDAAAHPGSVGPPGWRTQGPPVTTLCQASAMALVSSDAWDGRHVVSGYWAPALAVHKTAANGEPLGYGQYRIVEAAKQWIPPTPLVFGCGFLFGPARADLHLTERRLWLRSGADAAGAVDDEVQASIAKYGLSQQPVVAVMDTVADAAPSGPSTQASAPNAAARRDAAKEKGQGKSKGPPKRQAPSSSGKASPPAPRRGKGQRGQPDPDAFEVTEAKDPAPKASSRSKKAQQRRAAKYADQTEEEREAAMRKLQGDHWAQRHGAHAAKSDAAPGDNADADDANADDAASDTPRADDADAAEVKSSPSPSLPSAAAEPAEGAAEPASAPKPKPARAKHVLPVSHLTAAQRRLQGVSESPPPAAAAAAAGDRAAGAADAATDADADAAAAPDAEAPGDRMDEHNLWALLDRFTGLPTAEDEIEFALPVCAPWSAVRNYAFRVQLGPGSLKKGKASKAVVHRLTGPVQPKPRPGDDAAAGKAKPSKAKAGGKGKDAAKRGPPPAEHEMLAMRLIEQVPDAALMEQMLSKVQLQGK